jgi:uncharacterized protein
MARVIASDVVPLNHCPRRLWYEHNPPAGMDEAEPDPFDALILEMGIEHELAILESIKAGTEVVEAISVEHTQVLMGQAAPVIYQAQLLDGKEQLFGKPDFLLRQDDGTYRAADAKLAHSLKREIGVQLAFYRRLLGNDQPGLLYLGTGETALVGPEYDAHLDTYNKDARTLLSSKAQPEVGYSESKCTPCPFYPVCHPDFVEREDLTLLYGVDSRSVGRLAEHGFATITDLAKVDPSDIPDDVPFLKGARRTKAVLQARAWKNGKMTKLSEIVLPQGTWVHFDIEANPLTPDGHQHVYLWGFLEPPYEPENFEFVWTDRLEEAEAGWRAFLAKVEAYRMRWPDLKLVHFAHYERDRINAYAQRYGMEEHDTVK